MASNKQKRGNFLPDEEQPNNTDYDIDSDPLFLTVIQFLHLFSPFLPPLEPSITFNGTEFSPVHLRYCFIYTAKNEHLYWSFFKWIVPPRNQAAYRGRLDKLFCKEYTKRSLKVPDFLCSTSSEDPPVGEEDGGEKLHSDISESDSIFSSLTIQQRIKLLHDLLCIFLPWDDNKFLDLIGLPSFHPEDVRLEPVFSDKKDQLILIAGRLLYNEGKNGDYRLIAYDRVSWEAFFIDVNVNPLLKSRSKDAKRAINDIRENILPEALELCKFDDRCRRDLEVRESLDIRKRSPRVLERNARKLALERMMQQHQEGEKEVERKRRRESVEDVHRESRAERMARREHQKAMQELQSQQEPDEDTDIDPFSSPIKKVILRFNLPPEESPLTSTDSSFSAAEPTDVKPADTTSSERDLLIRNIMRDLELLKRKVPAEETSPPQITTPPNDEQNEQEEAPTIDLINATPESLVEPSKIEDKPQ